MTTKQRVAVVTGSSSGIGKSIALKLASDGYEVLVHAATNQAGAQQVAAQIRDIGVRSAVLVSDFRNTDNLSAFVDQCFRWSKSIDVWVNNAGMDVLTGEAEQWSFAQKLAAVLQVDVTGSLVLSRLVGRRMKLRFEESQGQCRGCIINMGWDQALQGMSGDSGQMFAASKGAVMCASQSLAQSLAPAVRVNCLAPGWVRTAWGEQASESWQARAQQDSLLSRWASPEDVANVAAFLASPQSEFVNGQIININGGFRFSLEPVEFPN